jgi:hypothetical protein
LPPDRLHRRVGALTVCGAKEVLVRIRKWEDQMALFDKVSPAQIEAMDKWASSKTGPTAI